jgi:hypothetical protein
MAGCRIEHGSSGTRVTLPSGQQLVCDAERVAAALDTRFQLANPKPPGTRLSGGRPRHPGPQPQPPDEADLLRNFHVDLRECWVATLTTAAVSRKELAIATTEPVEPPPSFVTLALNLVATEGWVVHHVAEDRAMRGDEVRLVSVRYLLRCTA